MRVSNEMAAERYSPMSRRIADIIELTRPRLTAMTLVTAAVGFVLASPGIPDLWRLAGVLFWLGAVVAGSTVLNQLLERDCDARMSRTESRPLPIGRFSPTAAFALGIILCLAGIAALWAIAGILTAVLTAASAAIYVGVYTPLKQRTSFNTLVGAISGALPPVVGWAGAADGLSIGAVALFSILFVWQLIHLFAIAWMYRDQYAAAGMVMISGMDAHAGALTMRLILLFSLSLIPISLLPTFVGYAGWLYVAVALGSGLWFLRNAFHLARSRATGDARRLFRASILYLPILLLALLIDHLI
jgi:protoheme IX farnesyltransferase